MKINIREIYKDNILYKYDETNREAFKKDFSPKEQEMWGFTLDLIKDGYPKQIYDSTTDNEYLNGYLELYLCEDDVVTFTISEWFNYLKSKE